MSATLPQFQPYLCHYEKTGDFHQQTKVWTRDAFNYLQEQLNGNTAEYFLVLIAHGWYGYVGGDYPYDPPDPVEEIYETIIVRPRMRCWGKGL